MEEKLISIEELIFRAKNLGIDFGKGDPKNRLRYYTKLGLISHAKRKCFNRRFPSGAYPESVLDRLLEIDRKLKQGKTIKQIKEEFERETEILEIEKPRERKSNFLKKTIIFTFIMSPVLITIYFAKMEKPLKLLSSILAAFQKKIAEIPKESLEKEVSPILLEPYLTINAKTFVKPSLEAKDYLKSPKFLISSGKFAGEISVLELTDNRSYIFPDESGQVCLSSGNCIEILGQVQTPGGTEARLAKFIGSNKIANSSIADLFEGILITIDERGRVGIATENPRATLEVAGNSIFVGKMTVEGEIEATGDICTELEGGKCLSELVRAVGGGGGGIGGAGTSGYLPVWTARTTLGNSILYQTGNTLYLPGDFEISGSLKIENTTLPQLLLQYDESNYLKFSVENGTSTILISGNLYINSLTGEIVALGSKISADSFVSSDATARSSGEWVFREAIPIFKYPIPAQSKSTNFFQISRYFDQGEQISSIPQLPSTQRKYAFLINMADDIPQNSSSTWRVFRPKAGTTYTTFYIQGQGMSSLEEGKPILTNLMDLPDNDWKLDAKVPSGNTIKVFNILLLVFDQLQ